MKLYDFREWNAQNRKIELTELENDEVLFNEEFSKIKKGWTVVDVGARVGYYTIKAGLLVGRNGKVLAIEPHPPTYSVLKMNIQLYGLNNVVPVCKAIGNKIGKVKLYEGIDSGGTSVISPRPIFSLDRHRFLRWLKFVKNAEILRILRKRYARAIYTPKDTLDRVTSDKNLGKIDLIKIDVQGAELDVLKGSHDILEKHSPTLLVEVHPTMCWKPQTLYELLRNLGYSLTMQKRRADDVFSPVYVVAYFGK